MSIFFSKTSKRRLMAGLWASLAAVLVTACGSSNSSTPPVVTPPPPASVTANGVVSDGPVSGGTLFVFAAAQVQAALDSVDPDGDRLAALDAADSVAVLTRDEADADQYTMSVPGTLAGEAAFFVFDNTDAEDGVHSDTPPNLESVAILGDAGSTQRINVSMQTTLIAQLVRSQLDPDGDGTPIDAAAIQTEIDTATASVLAAFATDAIGRDLYPADFDPVAADDDDAVHAASDALGFLVRAAAEVLDLGFDDVVAALAADAADGAFDGAVPMAQMPSPELEALAASVNDIGSAGSDEDIAAFAVGPCSSAAVSLRQACAVDTVDDLFESTAICTDIANDDDRTECLADAAAERAGADDECDDVFDARLALCETQNDAAHEPMFGPAFAANFVNPLEIGDTVPVNPWFPLKTGNRWVYAGDGETIDVEVTAETKLIDGITCVVIVDTASEDGNVVEITRDWYAQDLDGNVWYCGEIARNFELFEDDVPPDPELVDIDGSWKAGRDGAEPGILLPFSPQVGDVIRTEVLFGEAEDVIEIGSITATESSPGGSCVSTCLQTIDTTPLEPDVEELKYYAPGIGLIVEIDVETGDRVELTSFTPGI